MLLFRLIVILCCTMLIFNRCSKSGTDGPTAHMTMKIDGKVYSFNDSLSAKRQTAAPQLTLYARSSTAGNLQWLIAGFAPGTYSAATGTPADHAIFQCTVHAIAGSSNYQPLYNILLKPSEWVNDPFEIVITTISDQSVSGTFHGQLSVSLNAGHYAEVTDGSFTIPFK